MVSPWMEYGHMRDYVSDYPEVDRYGLVLGVATGVEYLHGFGMVCSLSLFLYARALIPMLVNRCMVILKP